MSKKIYSGDGWSFDSGAIQNNREKIHLLPVEHKLKIRLEKRGGNKLVSKVCGFFLSDQDGQSLAKELRTECGSGGTWKDNCIEIQGDQRTKIKFLLTQKGYKNITII